jgi:uncharacterized pyridoxal phosphate-containing UPF0001 family protein
MSTRKDEIAQNLQEVKERIQSAANSVNRDPNEVELIVVTRNSARFRRIEFWRE